MRSEVERTNKKQPLEAVVVLEAMKSPCYELQILTVTSNLNEYCKEPGSAVDCNFLEERLDASIIPIMSLFIPDILKRYPKFSHFLLSQSR